MTLVGWSPSYQSSFAYESLEAAGVLLSGGRLAEVAAITMRAMTQPRNTVAARVKKARRESMRAAVLG